MPRSRYDDEDDDRPSRRRPHDDDDDDDLDSRRSHRRSRDDDEDDDAPSAGGTGMATASLVLGILSICAGPLTGVIGGVLGLMAMRKPNGKGMAVTGMALSGVFSVVGIVAAVFGWMWYEETRNKNRTANNFKAAGLASHNYEGTYGYLPMAYEPGTRPTNTGQPPPDLDNRLSWRVTLLPYLNQSSLWNQFNRDEPWNSPKNQPLGGAVVPEYADVDAPADPATRVRCFYDNGAVFDTRYGRVNLMSISDGTSNTIFYVEGGDKLPWSKFGEYRFDPNGPLPKLGRDTKTDFWVVMGDGSVRRIKKTADPMMVKAAITRAGGEVTWLE